MDEYDNTLVSAARNELLWTGCGHEQPTPSQRNAALGAVATVINPNHANEVFGEAVMHSRESFKAFRTFLTELMDDPSFLPQYAPMREALAHQLMTFVEQGHERCAEETPFERAARVAGL
jgi:hypothetical protein